MNKIKFILKEQTIEKQELLNQLEHFGIDEYHYGFKINGKPISDFNQITMFTYAMMIDNQIICDDIGLHIQNLNNMKSSGTKDFTLFYENQFHLVKTDVYHNHLNDVICWSFNNCIYEFDSKELQKQISDLLKDIDNQVKQNKYNIDYCCSKQLLM